MALDWRKWVREPAPVAGPSAHHRPEILAFVGTIGSMVGRVLAPLPNERHSLTTVNGNPSAHGGGWAADVPAAGSDLIRLGQTALIAAGADPGWARQQRGGLFNVGDYQVIFNTNEGGNHYGHLHVGLQSRAQKAGGGASPVAASGIDSLDEFWYAVETKLGIANRPAARKFLQAWAGAEGTKARNNPLATTLQLPGSAPFASNPDGVQEYPTPELGAEATARTIQGYPSLLGVLKGSQSPFSPPVFSALNTWSGQRDKGAAMTPYVRNVILAFQGNPSGKSAADIGSFDLGDAASAAAGAASGALDAALAIPRFLAKLVDPHNLLRAGQILAGATLVLTGVVLLARQVALAADAPDPLTIASRGAIPTPAAAE